MKNYFKWPCGQHFKVYYLNDGRVLARWHGGIWSGQASITLERLKKLARKEKVYGYEKCSCKCGGFVNDGVITPLRYIGKGKIAVIKKVLKYIKEVYGV